MKKALIIFLLISLLAGGCAGAATQIAPAPSLESPAPAVSSSPSETKESPPPSSPAAQASPTAASSARKALLVKIEKSVFFRAKPEAQPQPASVGLEILPPGGIETGADGRARLDLQPEGTIVRVGPNSSFTLSELSEAEGKPQTQLELFFGKIYILLNGGSLSVKTPGGTAAVQGSVMSVKYTPQNRGIQVACLEGHCTVKDDTGDELELTDWQMTFIIDGEMSADVWMMDNEEFLDWYNEIPEMPEFFEEMPDPEEFPDPYFNFDEMYEMPTFEPDGTFEPDMTAEPDAADDPTGGGDGPTGGGEP